MCPPNLDVNCGGSGGTLLKTATICYGVNGSSPPIPPNCEMPSTVPTFPITEADLYTSLNSSASNRVNTTFDSYGNRESVLAYDFGGSSPISSTYSYFGQSWNGKTCAAYPSDVYIHNTPCYSHTQNSSAVDAAKTQITYSNTWSPDSDSEVDEWLELAHEQRDLQFQRNSCDRNRR